MKTKKEKLTLEFVFNGGSLSILWKAISTPAGLQEWFADSVTFDNKDWHFGWNGVIQIATRIHITPNKSVRYRWNEENDGSYFEFLINENPVTGSISLQIIDFSEADEMDSAENLWRKQIEDLSRYIGM